MNTASPLPSASISLLRWVWRAYFRTAMIPLLVVEVALITVYLFANNLSHDENITTVRQLADEALRRIAQREAMFIHNQIQGVAELTDVYRRQVGTALRTPYQGGDDPQRYDFSADGAYYSRTDNGGAAVFYSGIMPIGIKERDKVLRSARLDPLMKDIKDASPLIVQIYFNTFDSLNRIYPYFNVLEQYPAQMNIPSYNFYYEADAAHNPQRKVVWTDAYIDPAGAGWMASAIAPVYEGDFLEAVVGLDITVRTIADQVLNLDIPWEGYGVLIGKSGSILALPPRGETDWGLTELTSHSYATTIKQDTFKPQDFNLNTHPAAQVLAQEMTTKTTGSTKLTLASGVRLVSWATVANTGWRLLVLAPEERIYAPAHDLSNRLGRIGILMIVGLIGFYTLFFAFLFVRARVMSRNIAEPLEQIDRMAISIANGKYFPPKPHFSVTELQNTANGIILMGQQLGSAALTLRDYAAKLQRSHAELREFLFVASHDLQEPARKLRTFGDRLRQYENLLPPDGARFLERMLSNAGRIQNLLDDLVAYSALLRDTSPPQATDLDQLIENLCATLRPNLDAIQATLQLDTFGSIYCISERIQQALAQLIDNAIKFRARDRSLQIQISHRHVTRDGKEWYALTVSDNGIGIDPQYHELILKPFERLDQGQNTGTGIGLTLVQKIAEMHGGTLTIESEVGQGTTFVINLLLNNP